jgi:hypothetical protein
MTSMKNKFITNILPFFGGVVQHLIRPAIITLLWNYVVTYGTNWPKITFVQALVFMELIFRIIITYFPYKMMYMAQFPNPLPPDNDMTEESTEESENDQNS